MLFSEKVLLVGMACSQTNYLLAAHCWGCHLTSVCGYLSLTPEKESLWSDWPLLELLAYYQWLWMGYGQGHIEGDIMLLLGPAGVGHAVLA